MEQAPALSVAAARARGRSWGKAAAAVLAAVAAAAAACAVAAVNTARRFVRSDAWLSLWQLAGVLLVTVGVSDWSRPAAKVLLGAVIVAATYWHGAADRNAREGVRDG